jgi:hypothetical protein
MAAALLQQPVHEDLHPLQHITAVVVVAGGDHDADLRGCHIRRHRTWRLRIQHCPRSDSRLALASQQDATRLPAKAPRPGGHSLTISRHAVRKLSVQFFRQAELSFTADPEATHRKCRASRHRGPHAHPKSWPSRGLCDRSADRKKRSHPTNPPQEFAGVMRILGGPGHSCEPFRGLVPREDGNLSGTRWREQARAGWGDTNAWVPRAAIRAISRMLSYQTRSELVAD